MGQCTSGELPPHLATSDTVDSHTVKNGVTQAAPAPTSFDTTSAASSSSTSTPSHPKFTRFKPSRNRSTTAAKWVNRISQRHKSKDISATFNLMDYDAKNNYLDINTASEEELMILEGVTRTVAHSIVEYRAAIGGFRRVEDLALVSGVGAARLQRFRADVVVGGRRRSSSHSSSRTQSVDSLPSCESGRSQRSQQVTSRPSPPPRILNVNSASIFDLMTVRGMTQEMAANIVEYRERKGPFRTMEELVKVRGVSARVLNLLKVYLSVSSTSSQGVTTSSPARQPVASDVVSLASFGRTQRSLYNKTPGHRRTYSAPLNNDRECTVEPNVNLQDGISPRVSLDFNADIFELLSLRSERPIVRSVFSGRYQGRPALRIATWNLQRLTLDKISNLGVLEVVCRTVLENGFSLVALQEVASKDVLEKICSELNNGSLRRVREWSGSRGEWRWQVSEEPAGRMGHGPEYAAYIYNVEHGLQLTSSSLLTVHNNNHRHHSVRKPYLGYFKFNDYEFVVVSLHIEMPDHSKKKKRLSKSKEHRREEIEEEEGHGSREPKLTPLISALKEKLSNEKNIILLGHFSLAPDSAAFDVLREASYTNIVPADSKKDEVPEESEEEAVRNVNSVQENGKSSDGGLLCCLDNIWLNPSTRTAYNGQWGVIKEGLCHMAIPSGWGWGGAASDHPPVFCDLCPSQPSAITTSLPPSRPSLPRLSNGEKKK